MISMQQQDFMELPSELVRYDEPMTNHTSFKIGGPADIFLMPRTYEELLTCLQLVQKQELPFFLLGGGTNILVSDRGIRGVVISTMELHKIRVEGDILTAQTGATVEAVCKSAEEHGLGGIEFFYGMPGTIGGAVWMNARCYGGSISDVLRQAVVVGSDLERETVANDPELFGYKRSPFQEVRSCIWEVSLQLKKANRATLREAMEKNLADRVEKGHFTAPSAGSLFKNNRDFGAPTGKIIDELGLRGAVAGGAAIAPYHGNIFINKDSATAGDVLSLIRLAVETAWRERNILLEPEVRLVGDWAAEELAFLTPDSIVEPV